MSHPAVGMAAVIGVPDELWGERVHAVVTSTGAVEADELIDYARERLSGFTCPRSVEFRTTLPLSAAGKVLKAELRRSASVT